MHYRGGAVSDKYCTARLSSSANSRLGVSNNHAHLVNSCLRPVVRQCVSTHTTVDPRQVLPGRSLRVRLNWNKPPSPVGEPNSICSVHDINSTSTRFMVRATRTVMLPFITICLGYVFAFGLLMVSCVNEHFARWFTKRRGDDDPWNTKRFPIQKSGVVASVTTNHTWIRHANIDRTMRHSVFHPSCTYTASVSRELFWHDMVHYASSTG